MRCGSRWGGWRRSPALSHLCLLDCYAAGPEAVRHTEELTRCFTGFLQEGYTHRPAAAGLPELSSEAIAGAILQIIRDDVALGATATLLHRLPELAYIALAPFTGPANAAKKIEQARVVVRHLIGARSCTAG